MRRWALGFPPDPGAPVGGRPISTWLRLFVLCHAPAGGAWRREAWPDDACLLLQPWPRVAVFGALRDELQVMAREQRRGARH